MCVLLFCTALLCCDGLACDGLCCMGCYTHTASMALCCLCTCTPQPLSMLLLRCHAVHAVQMAACGAPTGDLSDSEASPQGPPPVPQRPAAALPHRSVMEGDGLDSLHDLQPVPEHAGPAESPSGPLPPSQEVESAPLEGTGRGSDTLTPFAAAGQLIPGGSTEAPGGPNGAVGGSLESLGSPSGGPLGALGEPLSPLESTLTGLDSLLSTEDCLGDVAELAAAGTVLGEPLTSVEVCHTAC